MKLEIRWEGEPREDILPAALADLCADLMCDVEDLAEEASGVITATALLSDNIEGLSVHFWGSDAEPGVLYAKYSESTDWVSMDDIREP